MKNPLRNLMAFNVFFIALTAYFWQAMAIYTYWLPDEFKGSDFYGFFGVVVTAILAINIIAVEFMLLDKLADFVCKLIRRE